MGPFDRHELREERREEHQERRVDRFEDRHDDRMERREDRNDPDHDGHPNSPVFHPGRSTRILISPGHGAGWITWAPRGMSDAFLVWMLTYEPLVRALENHGRKDKIEDIIYDFHKEARNRYGVERFNIARAGDIEVREVNYPFEIREKDGSEWIEDVTRMPGGVGGKRHINM